MAVFVNAFAWTAIAIGVIVGALAVRTILATRRQRRSIRDELDRIQGSPDQW